jgi:predicted TIM-barrel fold metal-dependent hydrolase
MKYDRRQFLKTSAWSLAAAASAGAIVADAAAQTAPAAPAGAGRQPLIDTNVHLFEWPFRKLKYASTPALVAKLRQHGVTEAWAGSFEALFSKDLSGVNARLVEECRRHGGGLLRPIGCVNPIWPSWEEDLRRCHEVHRVQAIRVHPCYHSYSLEEPAFGELLAQATARKLLVQVVLEMEDPRVHHPTVRTPSANPVPLVALLQKISGARVQLLGDGFTWTRMPQAKPLLTAQNLWHDFSSLEGVGGVRRLIEGKHWNLSGKIPLERMLFGSHAPYFPVESALLKLFESPFTLPELQAVMSANARRMLATT